MKSKPPLFRRLRVYTFDPSLATQLDTALINQAVLKVPWEEGLERGPRGEYLEIIDFDPATGCFYEPVDLNDPNLLATDGLAPSEGNPQFHQQMVYAVAMMTIRHFEKALGRKAIWAPHFHRDASGKLERDADGNLRVEVIDRLRVYPHALREANAYYSPDKKALLFGYFPALLANPGENLPGGLVFTCLSHDVIAHETTHALLDGIHRYFAEPSNPDVLAFHEAFADIVALFQHFSMPEALRHQIAETRGDLGRQNLLGKLAYQFGQAIGNRGALRDAIGRPNPETGRWEPAKPDPGAYAATFEPHDRGALLVAAMFDAFLAIYRARIEDLIRIATNGTGVLPAGEIHPDLVNRLADEAAKTAGHILRIAIRALDYCPPVDITFGEYLRAIVTADTDLVPDDSWGYRIAIIEAFRRRGIYPRGVRTLAADALLWQTPGERIEGFDDCLQFGEILAIFKQDHASGEWQDFWTAKERARLSGEYQARIHGWLTHLLSRAGAEWRHRVLQTLGLAYGPDARPSIYRGDSGTWPVLQVHAFRVAYRTTDEGKTMEDVIIEITQRRRGYLEEEVQKRIDSGAIPGPPPSGDFVMRGGCTLLIDGRSGKIRYAITKKIDDDDRLRRQREYHRSGRLRPSLRALYHPTTNDDARRERFAALHRHG